MVRGVVFAVLVALVASSASATPTTRMDRSRLRIGAYSFGKVAHDEAQVRAAKECGIDFVLGVKATDRAALDLLAKYTCLKARWRSMLNRLTIRQFG